MNNLIEVSRDERLLLWRAMGEIRRASSPGRSHGRKKPPPEPQLEPKVG